jgi:hypothetical protein
MEKGNGRDGWGCIYQKCLYDTTNTEDGECTAGLLVNTGVKG